MGLLKAAAWSPTDTARKVIREAFSAVGQTKIVEDSFNVVRAKGNDAPNKKVSCMMQWHALVEKNL